MLNKKNVLKNTLGILSLMCGLLFLTQAQAITNAGDACSTSGSTMRNGDSTKGQTLVCNGSAWVLVNEYDLTGRVGVKTSAPKTPLDVAGEIRVGASTGLSCDSDRGGALRYNSSNACIEFCDTSNWTCVTPSTCADTTPDGFAFPNLTNQSTSTQVTSSIAQVNGLGCSVSVQAYGEGSPQLRICSDSGCSTIVQDWTGSTSSIASGQYLQLRATTSATGGDTRTVNLSTGSIVTSWNITPTGNCTVGSPTVGTVCADGTIYVGTAPIDGSKMYMTRCLFGQTWDGSTCSGSYIQVSWASSNSTAGTNNLVGSSDGAANTSILVGATSDNGYPFPAAVQCDGLVESGKSDWYLPAQNETLLASSLLYAEGTARGNYESIWTSSGHSTSSKAAIMMTDSSSINSTSSGYPYPIRCFRHD